MYARELEMRWDGRGLEVGRDMGRVGQRGLKATGAAS